MKALSIRAAKVFRVLRQNQVSFLNCLQIFGDLLFSRYAGQQFVAVNFMSGVVFNLTRSPIPSHTSDVLC
jgi:hypothetical protein